MSTAIPFKTSRSINLATVLPIVTLFILLISLSALAMADDSKRLRKAMSRYLVCYPGSPPTLDSNPFAGKQRPICLSVIYHENKGAPLWVSGSGLNHNGWIILHFLQTSYRHGISPEKYQVPELLSLLPSLAPLDLARLDTLLSYNLLRYIADMRYGEDTFSSPVDSQPPDFDPAELVRQASSTADLATYLQELAPQHRYYLDLMKALESYTDLAQAGGWPHVSGGPLLVPGSTDQRVAEVRNRLQRSLSGFSPPPVNTETFYDDELVREVEQFQKRHGLHVDGILGNETIRAMNITVGEKLSIIRSNLSRWRHMDRDLFSDFVLVNIAAFRLAAVADGTVQLNMDVIVGDKGHQTPIFSDIIQYMDINPYWTIPTSIARDDELPALQKNPNHLVERNIRLFSGWKDDAPEIDSTTIDWHTVSGREIASFRMRQDPGPGNALGRIKFVFPNRYAVYMHDTPAKELFSHPKRGFSHGCIRVSDPPGLAYFLGSLQEPPIARDKLDMFYTAESHERIPLYNGIPVHITYQTCWVDKDGAIHFNDDIYGLDGAKPIPTVH